MAQVTISQLRSRIAEVNDYVLEMFPYYENGYCGEKKNAPLNIGQAYGGYSVELVIVGETGIHDMTNGHGTKREALATMNACGFFDRVCRMITDDYLASIYRDISGYMGNREQEIISCYNSHYCSVSFPERGVCVVTNRESGKSFTVESIRYGKWTICG